ncbi:MAG: prolipoprotein diacylglyceryl transferase [Cyclonatronaceae bacterium]
MTDSYFYWDGSPVAFTIPEISLPFSLNLIGLGLSLILFFGYPLLTGKEKDVKKKRGRKADPAEPMPLWKSGGLLLGAIVIGQLLMLPFGGPELSSIGPVMPRWYGVLFASGFLLGYLYGSKLFRDAGKPQAYADSLLTYMLIGTVLGARLGHVIFYDPDYYLRNLHEVLAFWQGGLASHGAGVGMLIAIWLYMKKRTDLTFTWLGDRVAMPVAIGGFFIRVGNFFNSEILGVPTDVPWAVVFARVDLLPRHPSMLYEAFWCIILLSILWGVYRYYRKNPPEGLLLGLIMIILFSGRILIEFTKVEQAAFMDGTFFTMGQLLSVPFILYGIWLIWKKVDFSSSEKTL